MVAEADLVVAEGLTVDRWEAGEATAGAVMDHHHHMEAAEGTCFFSHLYEMNKS